MADFHIPTAAIIGGETLIGREVRELLSALKPAPDVRLVSGEAETALISRDEEGEAIALTPLNEDSFTGTDAIFLAGTAEAAHRALLLAGPKGPPLIDLTGALEDEPRARMRAPQLEGGEERPMDTIDVIAHPAAIALALLLRRVAARFPISRCLVEVFEPASERGQHGLTELQTQTVNLLSFKPLPKETYDAQVSYNLLAAYGPEAPLQLDDIEARIDRHLASLLASARMPMPSLRVIQAPVFHGYSFSLWIEFEQAPGVERLEEAIACAQIEVRRAAEEPPTNVGAAGESQLIAGGIRVDRSHPRAYWLWMAADNLRLFADSAVAVAKEYL